ncbi:hypothetical protein BH10PAT3_BH10PAT3_0410 [soil metagenome]
MGRLSKFSPFARAIGVMGVTAGLVTGVTFASFNTNSVVLADSDLVVTSDVLRISNGGAYSSTSVAGFSDNLNPGVEGPKHNFYLQNTSTSNLKISVAVAADSGDIQGSGIHFKFYNEAGALVGEATYDQIHNTPGTLNGQLNAGAQGTADGTPTEGDYSYTVTVDQAAMPGSNGQVTDYDLTFTGTSLDTPDSQPTL